MRSIALACAAFGLLLVTVPAWPATVGDARDTRCITLSDVVILAGEEAVANKRLCKSPGSARYDVVEVTAAVYGAATTKTAFEKSSNPDLRAQREKIEALRSLQPEGRTGAEVDQLTLVRAQQRFIATLATNDLGYAETIEQFRDSVADIAGTPEGLAALARYNAGDEAGALTILDRLRTANDAARRKQSDLASAVEGRRIAGLARDARLKGKVTTATVIARYEEVTRLDPGVFDDWLELADDYYESYGLPDALRAAEMARKVAKNESDRAAALAYFGKVLLQQGDVAGSAKANGESLAIRRKLALADPANTEAQRAYAISIQRVGEVQQLQGSAALADKSLNESVRIFRNLSLAAPKNARAQRDIVIALMAVGFIPEEQGDNNSALNNYRECLEISQRLALSDPDNLEFKNDISVVQSRIGGVLFRDHDFAGAETAFEKSIAEARIVSARDPNANALYGLAASLDFMANLQFTQNKFFRAENIRGEIVAIYKNLAALDRTNMIAQISVASALNTLGEVKMARNDLSGAESAFDEGLAILRPLGVNTLEERVRNETLAASLQWTGMMHAKRGRLAEANQAFDEELTIHRKLSAAAPSLPYIRANLADCLARIGQLQLAQRNNDRAESVLNESLAISRDLISAYPKNPRFHRLTIMSLEKLADIPGSGIHWRDVVNQWVAMSAKGLLASSDRQSLRAARKKAASDKR